MKTVSQKLRNSGLELSQQTATKDTAADAQPSLCATSARNRLPAIPAHRTATFLQTSCSWKASPRLQPPEIQIIIQNTMPKTLSRTREVKKHTTEQIKPCTVKNVMYIVNHQ